MGSLKRTADILALENTVLLEIFREDVAHFLKNYPRFACNFVRSTEFQMTEACANQSEQVNCEVAFLRGLHDQWKAQALDARAILNMLHPLILAGFLRGVPSAQARFPLACPQSCRSCRFPSSVTRIAKQVPDIMKAVPTATRVVQRCVDPDRRAVSVGGCVAAQPGSAWSRAWPLEDQS